MDIDIIIPLNNEEANIEPLYDDIARFFDAKRYSYSIIFVDDHSTDNTGKIIDNYACQNPKVKAVHRKNGLNGMGISLQEGIKIATGDIIIWVMGDRSDDLLVIPKMLGKISDGYDMVFASRYMKGGTRGDLSPIKAFLSSKCTILAKFLFGIKVHDITNAFRCFKKDIIKRINLESLDFKISPELAIKAHVMGFKLAEVPCGYSDRKSGKTKFKILKMSVLYFCFLLKCVYRYRFLSKLKKDKNYENNSRPAGIQCR